MAHNSTIGLKYPCGRQSTNLACFWFVPKDSETHVTVEVGGKRKWVAVEAVGAAAALGKA